MANSFKHQIRVFWSNEWHRIVWPSEWLPVSRTLLCPMELCSWGGSYIRVYPYVTSPVVGEQYISLFLSVPIALVNLGRFIQFIIYTQSVGVLGRGISLSQSHCIQAEQYKHRIKHTDIHALSGIRTHDPSVRASEDSSCLRPRGHCDRLGEQ
jgi:hypothetical protein